MQKQTSIDRVGRRPRCEKTVQKRGFQIDCAVRPAERECIPASAASRQRSHHAPAGRPDEQQSLIRRVNQLYHELTQDVFDRDHRHRHRIERPFWKTVASLALDSTSAVAAENPAERVVIELACGTGFVAETLKPALRRGDRYIALDLCEKALHTTERKWNTCTPLAGGSSLVTVAADCEALPIADAAVDLVAINASLHHVPEPAMALREIDRILRPCGWFALGFEPNHRHFACPMLAALSRTIARAGWYASPAQNWRRLHEYAGCGQTRADHPDVLAQAMNDRLIADGFISVPLATPRILDLVDPHARGADDHAGFDPAELLCRFMPGYFAHALICSDYLGEGGRRLPVMRRVVDTVLRTMLPAHGSLFSWLLRKPGRALEGGC